MCPFSCIFKEAEAAGTEVAEAEQEVAQLVAAGKDALAEQGATPTDISCQPTPTDSNRNRQLTRGASFPSSFPVNADGGEGWEEGSGGESEGSEAEIQVCVCACACAYKPFFGTVTLSIGLWGSRGQ